jgi:hypothetical protein
MNKQATKARKRKKRTRTEEKKRFGPWSSVKNNPHADLTGFENL